VIEPGPRALELARVDLRGIEKAEEALPELARRIAGEAPQLTQGAIAIIDSPRWPCDLDWSQSGAIRRLEEVTARVIDRELQAIVKTLRATGARELTLSMFPTPRLDYFTRQIAANSCKPHLRAFGHELFGRGEPDPGLATGGSFTRFMLAGFATYRALGVLRITCYEGYPDLQFRLWIGNEPLPSKIRKKMTKADSLRALPVRQRLVAELAERLGIGGSGAVATLDYADAAMLALSVKAAESEDCGVVVEHQAEGRFWITLPANMTCLLPRLDD
jgi:hypothetical protein